MCFRKQDCAFKHACCVVDKRRDKTDKPPRFLVHHLINNFLLLEEIETKTEAKHRDGDSNRIVIENLTVSWKSENAIDFALRDVNLHFSDENLYVIAGRVGSGKSTLLKAVLEELHPDSGALRVHGKISYASQEPWLFNGSIRSNILFGEIFNESRYARVIQACALAEDLQSMPRGDQTVVGDGGSTLSGGQCARINLARAVYKEADIYLVDDSLASVDAIVGKHIIDNCINGLLNEKLRIFVSHDVQHFEGAAQIVIIRDGEIDFRGSHADLVAHNYPLPDLPIPRASIDKPPETAKHANQSDSELVFVKEQIAAERPEKKHESLRARCLGKPVLWRYFRAGGSTSTIFCLASSLILARLFVGGYDYWLAHWMKGESRDNTSPIADYGAGLDFKTSLYVFASLLLASVAMWTTSSLLFYKICVNASRNLHEQMFSRLLRAPMRFFELNPSGRILNRFSKDTGLVDETLPTTTLDALHVVLMMAGVAAQILIVNCWSVFPIAAMGAVCWRLQSVYLPTARALRRAESRAKSPVFSHASSTISGLTTVRSSRAQGLVQAEFDALQDGHSSARYADIATSSAYGFWLDVVSASLLAFVAFSLVAARGSGVLAGTAGLAVSQALALYGSVQFGLRQIAETATQAVSVERIFRLVDLDEEASPAPEELEASSAWPAEGRIRFDRVTLSYSEDEEGAEPVLKDVSLTVEPGEKVGIVGRTGSGKTSLVSSLFRLARPPRGSISIDRVDIRAVDPRELRRKISVVAQQPVVFTLSARDNLDPFRLHDDKALWDALEAVGLRSHLASLDRVMESGSLSAGQKQMFCVARAVLADNKILVLDEATASVDYATEEAVRELIETRFAECTVLTVAHRPSSVSRCDRILVMERGRIVKVCRPDALVQSSVLE